MLVVLCASLPLAPLTAAELGATAGFGRLWGEGGGYSGFAACADVGIPIGKNLSFTPSLGFWLHSETQEVMGYTATATMTLVTPAAGVRAFFAPKDASVRPYVGASAGVNFLGVRASAGGYSESQSDTYVGLNDVGGLSFRATPKVGLPVELSYGWIFGESSTVNFFTVKAGVTVTL
jgi:hypothetical protein